VLSKALACKLVLWIHPSSHLDKAHAHSKARPLVWWSSYAHE
jgi:hypothetical protein